MKRANNWTPLGALTQRIAGKLMLRQAEILEGKMAAAPTGESDGQGGLRGDAAVESALTTQGRNVVRASAHDREGSGALIGGVNAQPDSRISIVGMSLTPGRAIANAPTLKLGRDSIR